jgi:hypothetical protein
VEALASALLLCVGLGVASPRSVLADDGHDPVAAQAAFEDGMALMAAKRYREACAKFEVSQRLDPGMGTQFRLAECYANLGRVASAYRLYSEVMEAAKRERLASRERAARQKVEALRNRLPRLTIRVAPIVVALVGLKVLRDGAPVEPSQWGVSVPIDPGEHTVEVTAQGKTSWQGKITAAESATLEMIVPALEDAPSSSPPPLSGEGGAPPPLTASAAPAASAAPVASTAAAAPAASLAPPAPPPPDAVGMSRQRVGAIFAGMIGVSGILVGTVMGFTTQARWEEALKQCGGQPRRCSAKGMELGGQAENLSIASTIGFAVGGVGLVAGTVLWLTAPARAARPNPRARFWVTPGVGPDGIYGVATARF